MPWVKGNPTIRADKTQAYTRDTVTFNWDSNGGAGCYLSVNGNKNTDLSGSGSSGVIPLPLKDVAVGTYSVKISCTFDTLRESTPVTIDVKKTPTTMGEVLCNPPTITADKPTVKVGETVTFSWRVGNT